MKIGASSFYGDLYTAPTSNNLTPKESAFRFIDLFAGVGGFHIAGEKLGGECVFTSEWDEDARAVYRENFIAKSPELFTDKTFAGDINEVAVKEDIPSFDVLFAGFPCQPFSKGGFRRGFNDVRGNLFFKIAEIIDAHNPRFLLLENVANLVSHDEGNTFKVITEALNELGYALHTSPLILSPHMFGVPVLRPRIFIPAIRKDIAECDTFTLNFDVEKNLHNDAYSAIDEHAAVDPIYRITPYEEKVLEIWDDFYQNIDLDVIGFPVWADYFKHKGTLDSYPKWKQEFIRKNIDLYKRNKKFIDEWLKKNNNLNDLRDTHKKFEWQAGNAIGSVYEGLIQFRPSGVRVKRPDKFSTLVAMNHAQIVGKYKRRLTIDEAKKLQSLPDDFQLHPNKNVALKQLGNGVNAKVVEIVLKKILSGDYEKH